MDSRFAGQVAAPEFSPGLDWINVEAPLSIGALRGKVVLLDFWTYGCINCIHMIPTLERLEAKYGAALVVIGVHSAKFDNEGETDNVRQIVKRYGLAHPVINDDQFIVWRSYSVRAWPTFMIIDPRGNIVAQQAGEVSFAAFDGFFGGLIAQWDSLGEIDRTPVALTLEGAGVPSGLLSFPGKILADAAGGRLFIADTNHHRIISADLHTHAVIDVIGGQNRRLSGFDDGTFDTATFNKPQGMALLDNVLYVADTDNHAIRALYFADATVTTVAGTGQQSVGRAGVGVVGAGTTTALNSPWDVTFGGDLNTLYIAMAGTHQLWALDTQTGSVSVIVGNGREALRDSTFADAELAQPSGVYVADNRLYWADSESSSIRAADLATGTTYTVAGTLENSLFNFGDVDGVVGTSRLQHALGVTGSPAGTLYIADTYNSRIKALDPTTNTLTTLGGTGSPGAYRDGALAAAAFDEPGGISYADGRLYVADTNNHALRVIDLAAGTVETIVFPNPEALQISGQTTVIGGNRAQDDLIAPPAQIVAPGAGAITLRFVLPDGCKLNADAPSRFEFNSEDTAIILPVESMMGSINDVIVTIPTELVVGMDTLYGLLEVYYCAADAATLCYIDRVRVEAAVTVAAGAAGMEMVIERVITLP
ncbi:MAG: thioredoxin-like domain-containing protein [Chloroflexota bacterium]|nr:thioredoxin-like domain-containing protein [Chloroflexota bacterium]